MRTFPLLLCLTFSSATAQIVGDYRTRSVPFDRVEVSDRFWRARLDTNTLQTVPHSLEQCERTGRVDNFRVAAGLNEGHYQGWWFNDSDVYKVLEGAAYSLQLHPDPALAARIDSVIAVIEAAQEPDGYLYAPRRTTAPGYEFQEHIGPERWSNLASSHELYVLGHLYEAAVAYYGATGKRTLLDVATRSADLLVSVFGPGKNRSVPGHQEIEIGLVKLYRVTGDERYAALARFFLEERGKPDGHALYGEYSQDHLPVRDQTEAVGHAVRALYMYSGMSDIAALYADSAYRKALGRLWEDVVGKKTYLTGGIGAAGGHEGFSDAYVLPNLSAYCETCAAIASVLWNQRMYLLTGDPKYVDVLERTLYNGVLSGVALDGRHFFYPNPLESDGRHARSAWFAVACCPPNVGRLLPQIGSMAYAFDNDQVTVNLFLAGRASIPLDSGPVTITQESDYPWSGAVTLEVDPGVPGREFTIALRVPGWARGEAIPLDLYRFLDTDDSSPSVTLNGAPQHLDMKDGYVRLRRPWRAGDRIHMELPMPVRRIVSRQEVEEDSGKVALQRGPLVYCLEGVDVRKGRVLSVFLPDRAALHTERRDSLLGGVSVIQGQGEQLSWADDGTVRSESVDLAAIPYYAWAHRGRGEMAVWMARTASRAIPIPLPSIASKASASSSGGDVGALNDQREPQSSADRSSRYLHWWPRKGTREWVQYDLHTETTVSSVDVYWYDDTGIGECRVPSSWHILYRAGESWKPVSNASGFGVSKDRYNRTTFDPVRTTGLRLVVQLPDSLSAGIHEWRVN